LFEGWALKLVVLMLARQLATGTLTYTRCLIDALNRTGAEIVVAYFGESPPTLPCRIVSVDSGPPRAISGVHLAHAFRFLLDALKLRSVVKLYRPNLVFAQGIDELGMTAVLASKMYRVPGVSFVHDLTIDELLLERHGWASRMLASLLVLRQKAVIGRLTGVLVSSEFMKRSLEKSLGRTPAVTPLGASEEFRGIAVLRNRSPFRLIFVGNLTEKKMPQVAILALPYINNLDVRLTIVGDGPMRVELEDMCRRMNLTGKVDFAGRLDRPELLRAIGSAHLCVVTSKWEGFGLAALEAMAAGVPVVASSSGALREIVRDGRDGFLFTLGNSKELAAKISRLAEDEELWKTMAANCRRDASEYTWQKTAISTLEAVRQVIGKS